MMTVHDLSSSTCGSTWTATTSRRVQPDVRRHIRRWSQAAEERSGAGAARWTRTVARRPGAGRRGEPAPTGSAAQRVAEAYLEIVDPPGDAQTADPAALQPDRVPDQQGQHVRRDPDPGPGVAADPVRPRRQREAVAGGARRHLRHPGDVRVTYVDKLRGADVDQRQAARAADRGFVWDRPVFTGGAGEASTSPTCCSRRSGIPLRAKLDLSLKEYRRAAVQALRTTAAVADRGEELRGAPRRHAGQHRGRRSTAARRLARAGPAPTASSTRAPAARAGPRPHRG